MFFFFLCKLMQCFWSIIKSLSPELCLSHLELLHRQIAVLNAASSLSPSIWSPRGAAACRKVGIELSVLFYAQFKQNKKEKKRNSLFSSKLSWLVFLLRSKVFKWSIAAGWCGERLYLRLKLLLWFMPNISCTIIMFVSEKKKEKEKKYYLFYKLLLGLLDTSLIIDYETFISEEKACWFAFLRHCQKTQWSSLLTACCM